MKILALSDQVVDFVYSPSVLQRFRVVDLLVGCGDLPAYYLEYLVSTYDVPLVYVPGNHDPDRYAVPGGECVDGKLVRIKGVSIMGLGGSRRYKREGRHQYTEGEMRLRATRQMLRLLSSPGVLRRGLDLLITHAPPKGVHDAPDWAHLGFASFHTLLRFARPRLMLHGHSHAHRNLDQTKTQLFGTRVINVFPYRLVELSQDG